MISPNIEEWVRWHIALGFDHIYLYDNEDLPMYGQSAITCKTHIKNMFDSYSCNEEIEESYQNNSPTVESFWSEYFLENRNKLQQNFT